MAFDPLRFGIVGPGSIARLHCRAIRAAEGADVVAICGRDEVKTSAFAEEHHLEASTDLSGFLARSDIDAICIATASGAHLEIGLQAAAAGKHILCEKPLEVTPEKSQQLIVACAENNVTLGVFFQARFDRCTQLVKNAIDCGRLGRLLMASCQMRWFRTQDYYDSAAWRGTWALDGGGCLMNQGIHTLDLLVYLAGKVDEVTAFQGPVTHKNIEVEDNLCAAVRFCNGAVGTIEVSTSCAPGFPRRVMISGEKGSIEIEDNRIVRWEFDQPEVEDDEIIAAITNAEVTIGGAADPTAIADSGHRLVVEDFVASIRQNRSPLIDGVEGCKSVDLVTAIYRSMHSGAVEQV